MELNATAQITRKKISRKVFRYRFQKGRLSRALKKLSKFQWEGRIWGGMAMDSAWVLKLVSSIQAKGKIMVMLPAISAA